MLSVNKKEASFFQKNPRRPVSIRMCGLLSHSLGADVTFNGWLISSAPAPDPELITDTRHTNLLLL